MKNKNINQNMTVLLFLLNKNKEIIDIIFNKSISKNQKKKIFPINNGGWVRKKA